ncbi:MAG TPA: glycosyltransferase family 39 protein [Acidobacteriaceae bacterium]|nr:glycosyltransferase family 39 protein [Acidobacteriaceae bacterium]
MAFSFLVTVAIAVHSGPTLRYGDEAAYEQLASHLVHLHRYTADGLRPTAYRPPGYAWFLAVAEEMGASTVALRIVNASALVLAQLFLFLLVRAYAAASTAAIALLLTLAYPVLFYTATLLFPQTVGAALLLCGIWLLIRREPMTLTRGILAGVVWGFLILTIPTFLLIAGLAIVAIGWRRKQARPALLAALLTIGVLLGTWTYRNYHVFHAFVLVSTNGGANLLLGNSEDATGDSNSDVLPLRYSEQGHKEPSEVAADRYYSGQAKQWIIGHPARAIRLYLAKLVHYFAFVDHLVSHDNSSRLLSRGARLTIMLMTWGPLLFLFFLRLALCRKYPLAFAEVLFAGLYLFNAVFISIFFARIRFRIPMDWLLIAIDAGMVQLLLNSVNARRASAAVVLATGDSHGPQRSA